MKNTKKITGLFLVFCMLLTLTPALAIDSPFTDVRPDDWFYPYVSFVHENDIMQGTSTTTFSPNQNFTRAQVAATLFRIHFGRVANETDQRANTFTDVPENAWFAPYVTWASENGIVNGVGNNLFAPADYVTKQQFAVMLHRFADSLTNLDTDVRQSQRWNRITDRNQIASWAEDGLRWGHFHRIISGRTTTTLEPAGTVSRAEVAATLTRFVLHMRIAEISADDFELTISVEEAILPQGERFRVNVELKNNSGQDLKITYSSFYLLRPYVTGVELRHHGPGPGFVRIIRFFEADSVLRNVEYTWRYGDQVEVLYFGSGELEPGIYEFRVIAIFWLVGSEDPPRIEVWSNPITLTVK